MGRPLAPGLAFQTVDLTLPGEVYADRINSVDMRVAKVFRFHGYRTDIASTSTICSTRIPAPRSTRSTTWPRTERAG